MIRLFTKKQFFAFWASSIITFVSGFFVWNIFINSDSALLNQSKIFTASILPVPEVKNIIPATESEQIEAANQDSPPASVNLADSAGAGMQNPVAMTEQEKQDLLDDISEKIDIIKQQVLLLQQQQNPDIKNPDLNDDKKLEDDENKKPDNNLNNFELQTSAPKVENITYVPPPVFSGGSGGGGGSAPVVYHKILISEAQISPIGQRFVELYNPNNSEIDLTGWYLQRKTETGSEYASFVTKNDLLGKKINANDYFLISKLGVSADITLDLTLTENNSLVLKNPNGEVSDKLGFGSAQDFELSPAINPEDNKSIGRKFDENTQNYFDTDNNFTDFELDAPTPKTQNTAYVEPPAPVDTTPPEVSFNLNPTQNNLNFTINFTIADPIDTVTPSGLASYVFQWKEDVSDWQQDLPAEASGSPSSADLTRDFTGEDGKTYYFQVKATDVVGNVSNWLPETSATTKIIVPVVAKSILINEIQTEGQTARDEFIEFYNPNNFDVDLAAFSLKKKTSSGNESNLVSSANFSGTILALGYFLIVSQNNEDGTPNYTGSATPDLYYSGKSYSIASNNAVLFYDKNDNLQDKVGFGDASDFETAPVVNPPEVKSIARTSGIDTNDNSQDFIILDTPTPTNSSQ